jgi:ABC-2 type transport system permease protein
MTAVALPALVLPEDETNLTDEARTVAMVWRRELIRFERTRIRILTSLAQPILFLFVLGYGMSGLVGTTAGFDFKKFVFPGVVAMSVVSTAIFSAVSIVW